METATTLDRDAALSALTDDNAKYKLPDGRTLRLKVEPDPDSSINDWDSDGKLSELHRYSDRDDDGHPPERPKGFDGRAVKIEVHQGYWAWWQPCEGAVYATPADFEKDRQRIADLARFAFVGLVLELCDAEPDAYGRLVVRKTASLWALEWDVMSSDYGREVVGELLDELL